jgi:hypothetical protein
MPAERLWNALRQPFSKTDKDVLTNFIEFAASFARLLEIRFA